METAAVEKISVEPVEENLKNEESITFDKYEWKNFLIEITDMVKDGKKIDFEKAVHNARYLASIDRATERMNAGHWVEHDLIEVEDDD